MSGFPDSKLESILAERAKRIAQEASKEALGEVEVRVAVVEVGPERFGIPVDGLKGIIDSPPVARLPGTPAWIKGIAQVRGDILCVVDLATWFELGSLRVRQPLLAIVEGPEGDLGLLFDMVVEVRDIKRQELVETSEKAKAQQGRPIRASTRDLISILDLECLFESPDLIVDLLLDQEGVAGG